MILWKYLLTLKKEDENEGFTLPLIIGFGLFMLSIGLMTIKMSSDSQVNSQVQERTYQALAAAEVGVTQFQEFLNQAPLVATVPACHERDSAGDCTDTGSDKASWFNPDFSAVTTSNENSELCTSSTVVSVPDEVQNLATNNQEWIAIDDNDETKGEYRLVEYSYSSAPGVFPATGTLVVDGRTRDANQGTTRLSVDIPVRRVTQTDEATEPGLWMRFDENANLGSQFVRGNILIENATCSEDDPNSGLPSQLVNRSPIAVDDNGDPTGELIASKKEIPDTPALPPDSVLNKLPESDALSRTLPRSIANGDGVNDLSYNGAFHYLVPKLESNGNASITIADGQRVVFYVQGNINFTGTINRLSDDSSSRNLEIYGNTTVSDGSGYGVYPDYKYGCYTNDSSACPTTGIALGGASEISAFIHAPEAWGCITGGSSGANANITGAIWLEQWVASEDFFDIPDFFSSPGVSCTGDSEGSGKLVIDSMELDENGNLVSLIPDNVKTDLLQPIIFEIPRLSSSSEWLRQEVTDP